MLSCKPEQLLLGTIDEDCREVHEDIACRQQTVAIYTSVRSLVLVYCLRSPQRVIGPIIGQRLLAISVRLLSLSLCRGKFTAKTVVVSMVAVAMFSVEFKIDFAGSAVNSTDH